VPGGPRSDFVAEDGFKIRRGSNPDGFEPSCYRGLVLLLFEPCAKNSRVEITTPAPQLDFAHAITHASPPAPKSTSTSEKPRKEVGHIRCECKTAGTQTARGDSLGLTNHRQMVWGVGLAHQFTSTSLLTDHRSHTKFKFGRPHEGWRTQKDSPLRNEECKHIRSCDRKGVHGRCRGIGILIG
jgi:hypothetical protein